MIQHYGNMPKQYTEIFKVVKNEKKIDIFNIFAQNIDCRYTLQPPRRGDSKEYPQSMLGSKVRQELRGGRYRTCIGQRQ